MDAPELAKEVAADELKARSYWQSHESYIVAAVALIVGAIVGAIGARVL